MWYYIESDMSQNCLYLDFLFYDQSTVGLKLNFDILLSTMCYMKFVKSCYVFCQSYIIPSAINMGHELYIYFIKQKLNKTTDKLLLHIVVSSTYCVVFLFCSSSSCVPSLDLHWWFTPSVLSNVYLSHVVSRTPRHERDSKSKL